KIGKRASRIHPNAHRKFRLYRVGGSQGRARGAGPRPTGKIMVEVIFLRGVSKSFEGKRKVTALQQVDLEIARGEMVSIVGPSGSGKSTMLNLIGGLDHPSTGEIELDGERLSHLDDDGLTRVRRDKIGFIFQFFNLLPTLTCLENVSLPLHLRGWARKQ